jgi:hypothetical protein
MRPWTVGLFVCVCVCLCVSCVSVSVASPDFAPRLKKKVVVALYSKYTRALVFENLCFFFKKNKGGGIGESG